MKKYSDQEIKSLSEYREKCLVSNLAGGRRHAQLYEPYKISLTEFRTLTFLMWNPDGAEPSLIADSLLVLRQTMTKVIDSLESRGLVKRTEHPTDRRSVYIRMQPAGVELTKKLLEIETDFTQSVAKYFTKEEMDTYDKLFWRMQEAKEKELRRILEVHTDPSK